MLKMHLPKQAVINKMSAEGLDPAILDMDPNQPAPGAGPAAAKKKFKLPPKKKSNLKPLYWDKVDSNHGHLLWTEWANAKDEDAPDKIDEAEKKTIVQLFTQRKPKKSTKKKKDEVEEEKPKEFSAFDSKRNFNLGIILKTVSKKIKAPVLRDALIGMDSAVITNDLLIQLRKFAPDKEEIQKMKDHLKKPEDTREPFDALTKYIYTVFGTIDGVDNIFEIIRIQLEATDTAKRAAAKLELIHQACGQVLASVDLRRLLQLILSIGNSINKDTARGNAVGFKISGTSDVEAKQSYKLSDCKLARVKSDAVGDPESEESKDPDKPDLVPLGGNTLLHFIADVAQHHKLDMTMIMDDLPSVDDASENRMVEIEAEVKSLEKDLKLVANQLARMTAPETVGAYSEEATASLAKFVETFTDTVASTTKQYQETLASANNLLSELGEEVEGISDLFIGIWFCRLMCLITTLQIASEDNVNFKLELEVKRKKEEAKAERAKLRQQASLSSMSSMDSTRDSLGDMHRPSDLERPATVSSNGDGEGGHGEEPMGLMDSLLAQARNQSLRKSKSMTDEEFGQAAAKGRMSSIRRSVSGQVDSDEESDSESDGWHSDGSGD